MRNCKAQSIKLLQNNLKQCMHALIKPPLQGKRQPEKSAADKNQLKIFKEERLSSLFPKLNYLSDIEITDEALHMKILLIMLVG